MQVYLNKYKACVKMMSKDLLLIPEQDCGCFHLNTQYVSFKEDTSHLKKTLSEKDFQLFLELYEKSQSSVKKALKPLEEFKKNHPKLPEIYNLLGFVYIRLKKLKKAEQLIREAYQECPENLFVRINYGDHYLRKKQPEKIPEIFKNTFDLSLLYPSRKTFHVSEFRGFMTLMGFYYLSINKRDLAISYHYLARHVAPHHPAVRLLGRKLYYVSILKNLFTRFKSLLISVYNKQH